MGVRRVFKKFLKYLVPTLLVLLIIPVTSRRHQDIKAQDSFRGKPLKCALMLGSFDRLSKGYLTGFNYELLGCFASSHSDSTEIFLADTTLSCRDSLLEGSLDILVVPASEAPEEDAFTSLCLSDTTIAWVLKADPVRTGEVMRWFNSFKATQEYSDMLDRFFAGYNPYRTGVRKDPRIISPYDGFIKEGARTIGWDWRLLAALVWSESMFRIQARSPRGAFGLMQMMPRTADRFGIEHMLDPEENIMAGARYLALLQRMFGAYTADQDALTRLVIAAYNCGAGRTMEDLDGREQTVETAAYVKKVLNQYDIFRGEEPRYRDVIEVADSLLGPDSLGGVDPGYEQAGDQEEDHDDGEGDDVGEEDGRQVEVHGHEGHEIILRI